MPTDLNYAHEKYSVAVRILATGDGSKRERLLDAFRDSASRAYADRDDPGLGPAIPDELRRRMGAFDDRMTSATPDAGEGSIEATIRGMSEDQVANAMEELLDIGSELEWAFYEAMWRSANT